ncbi:unnamed protein product [Paramecium sonneborni]|uniref:CCHC-type domain-containing protein n=1 Tax=Paramecium sonneborni TaxID=65129 RepID=A0A8S1MDI1_9CILI|nr:unnamed protein product [Paramecium sonneborni]
MVFTISLISQISWQQFMYQKLIHYVPYQIIKLDHKEWETKIQEFIMCIIKAKIESHNKLIQQIRQSDQQKKMKIKKKVLNQLKFRIDTLILIKCHRCYKKGHKSRDCNVIIIDDDNLQEKDKQRLKDLL